MIHLGFMSSGELCVPYELCVIHELCTIEGIILKPLSPEAKGLLPRGKASLEADCLLSEVLRVREAHTGYPALGVRIEALEEAEAMLLLNQLCRSHTLELLAQVIASNFSICRVEEEEDVLLLILHSVELAGSCLVGLISEGDTLGEVAHFAVITCDFGHVVYTLVAVKILACHSCKYFKTR